MANFEPQSTFDNVRIIEPTDRVLGGKKGAINVTLQQIVNRTEKTKDDVVALSETVSVLMPAIKRNTAYATGDCASAKGLHSWMYLECVIAGTTSDTEPVFTDSRVASQFMDGTAVFVIKDIRCKYRTGQIVTMWGTPAEYDYLLLCDGSQISEELYPELVRVLGGNTLPNLIGRFLEGANTSGEYHEAGLPNIEGEYTSKDQSNHEYAFGVNAEGSGAFKNVSQSGTKWLFTNSSNTYAYSHLGFDASLSNPIYGNSDTVQPKSMTIKHYICYAG